MAIAFLFAHVLRLSADTNNAPSDSKTKTKTKNTIDISLFGDFRLLPLALLHQQDIRSVSVHIFHNCIRCSNEGGKNKEFVFNDRAQSSMRAAVVVIRLSQDAGVTPPHNIVFCQYGSGSCIASMLSERSPIFYSLWIITSRQACAAPPFCIAISHSSSAKPHLLFAAIPSYYYRIIRLSYSLCAFCCRFHCTSRTTGIVAAALILLSRWTNIYA